MPTLTAQAVQPPAWQPPPVLPLNQKMWDAWEAKCRFEDRHIVSTQLSIIKWVVIMALLATAILWSRLSPYEVVPRFIVAVGSAAAMLRASGRKQYWWSVVFASLVVLYNPVLPVLAFSGDWQRALVVVCVAPFALSLRQAKRKPASHA